MTATRYPRAERHRSELTTRWGAATLTVPFASDVLQIAYKMLEDGSDR
jgi:hypothetical protein